MNMKRVTKPIVSVVFFLCITMLLASSCNPPLETVEGDDGSLWERVNQPGFGDDNNSSVVAMAEYQGRLYAMTRNEVEGVEVWRTSDSGWEQVLFPGGETNGIYGNTWINNLWGGMSCLSGRTLLSDSLPVYRGVCLNQRVVRSGDMTGRPGSRLSLIKKIPKNQGPLHPYQGVKKMMVI